MRLKNDKVLSLVTAFLLPGNTGVVLCGRPDEMLRLRQIQNAFHEGIKSVSYTHLYGQNLLQKVLDTVGDNNTGLIFQTKDKSITNHKWADKFISAFSKQFDMHVIQDNPTFKDIVIDDELSSFSNRYADVESTIYCNCNYHIDDLRKLLGDEFVVTLSSFKEPEPYSGEITLRGVNKATGIRDVVEFLHMSQADTIGFGDGQNDFDMLRYCDVGVAMGNSSDEVKAVADIVTDDIKEDGLKNAMVHLGLV